MLAFQYCRDHELRDTDVIFKFEDARHDIPLAFDCPLGQRSVQDESRREGTQRKNPLLFPLALSTSQERAHSPTTQ